MQGNQKTVVVIGAGIVGVSTALWLQRDGHDVVLIDKSEPGEGTSYGNAGLLASAATLPVPMPGLLKKAPLMALDPNQPLFLRLRHFPRLLPWLIPYLRYANETAARQRAKDILPIIGDSLADHQALAEGTDAARFIVPCDYLYGYPNEAAYLADKLSWNVRREQGFQWYTLKGQALRDYDRVYSDAVGFGAILTNHGRISDPGMYVKTLAKFATRQGARVLRAEVTDIVVQKGCVKGVRAGGENVPCNVVVLTAGVWSKTLAERFGLRVPLHPESGFHLEFWEPSEMPRGPMMHADGKFVITPMEGRIRLAGMVGYGGFDAVAPRKPYELFLKHLRRVLPNLTWKETREWMGHRPAIVDSIPMIGTVDGVIGAYVGFGHDHVGLTGGPKTGRILAQLVSGKTPNLDLTPYKPDRFG